MILVSLWVKKKKKDSIIIKKEVCRHTNEQLAFKERLACGIGCADSRKARSYRVDK